jgi:hypothetical protein
MNRASRIVVNEGQLAARAAVGLCRHSRARARREPPLHLLRVRPRCEYARGRVTQFAREHHLLIYSHFGAHGLSCTLEARNCSRRSDAGAPEFAMARNPVGGKPDAIRLQVKLMLPTRDPPRDEPGSLEDRKVLGV